jgi:hypothetical protein
MPVRPACLVLCLTLSLTGCAESDGSWPVRATLDDGQVLLGAVDTPVLSLEGGLGTIAIPWDDVGEVSPVEGDALAASGGFVGVWLRNGSELTGRWTDPQLAMEIQVGGQGVAVDVPVGQLLRLQTQGGEAWPQGMVYRARTTHGDDFLVDPTTTRLALVNAMGRFEPLLTECLSAAPVAEATGPWRVELLTGTVLVGPLADDKLTLRLPMGPAEVTVPLATLVSLTREDWGESAGGRQRGLVDRLLPARGPAAQELVPAPATVPTVMADDFAGGAASAETAAVVQDLAPAPRPAVASPAGWFDASELKAAKQAMD